MAKAIYVSTDSGTTWYILPGSTGALNVSAGSIVDTIFGQIYESHESGIITWTMNGQAIQKGQAGYKAILKKAGSTTTMTAEAMSAISGPGIPANTYQVTNLAHSIWDRNTALVFKTGGTAIPAAQVLSVDPLFGRVTFNAAKTTVTVDGAYKPTTNLCGAQSFSLKQTANALTDTDFCAAQSNGGFATNSYGLKIISLDLSAIYDITYGFLADLIAHTEYMIEISPDGLGLAGGGSVARGFFKLTTDNASGNVGALEIDALTFELYVPVKPGNISAPFSWVHGANTMLSAATIAVLNAWQNGTNITAAYSPYGNEGSQGSCIVTDATLNSSMTTMCEFTTTFTGDGVLTPYTPAIIPSGLSVTEFLDSEAARMQAEAEARDRDQEPEQQAA